MKTIYPFTLLLLIAVSLYAQKPVSGNTITASFNDPFWKYVKDYTTNHWDTLKGYEVTFTGVVFGTWGVDGNGNDCDSTFNIYIKNNEEAQQILASVKKANPQSVPPCIDTAYMHIEVNCRSAVFHCDYCNGLTYPDSDHVQLPSIGDSVAITGRLMMDIHRKCQFEIHPVWNIVRLGKAKMSYPLNIYLPEDCETMRKNCK